VDSGFDTKDSLKPPDNGQACGDLPVVELLRFGEFYVELISAFCLGHHFGHFLLRLFDGFSRQEMKSIGATFPLP